MALVIAKIGDFVRLEKKSRQKVDKKLIFGILLSTGPKYITLRSPRGFIIKVSRKTTDEVTPIYASGTSKLI